jgi:hypothetical protein
MTRSKDRAPREPYQRREYRELQGSKPCCHRGELETDGEHTPATSCCKAKEIVKRAWFRCRLLDKDIHSHTTCHTCSQRQVELPPESPVINEPPKN